MALIKSGIDKVRAFELPDGIWADGKTVASSCTVLVKWRSCWSDKFYQIYVDGRYAGATIGTGQREMIVKVPSGPGFPARIEVFAVLAEDVNRDFSGELDAEAGRSGRVMLALLRGQNLSINTSARFYFDGGSGLVDYDNPLDELPVRVWPSRQDKAGFGMSRFGLSDFGYGSSAAVGYGRGSFGQGQFGIDADTLTWVSRRLCKGVYKFGVKIIDAVGNASCSETNQVMVLPGAVPGKRLAVSSFDKEMNQLVLSIT